MKKQRLRELVLPIVSSALLLSLGITVTASAAEDNPHTGLDNRTPTVIYSTIEGGSAEIEFKSDFPVSADTKKTWICNDEELIIDNENYVDSSEGSTLRLAISNLKTSNHMDDYSCIISDAQETGDDFARLYVISRDNYLDADLATREMTLPEGSYLRAKDVTLYIDSTPYPNFAPLKFIEDGEVRDYVTVKKGKNKYDLTDTVLGRSVTLSVTGVGDETCPDITDLYIKDGKEDKYATSKTIEVKAKDDYKLDDKPFYFEAESLVSQKIKSDVMAGKKASEIMGISWSEKNTYKAVSNGTYTVFVRDSAGNIAFGDITVKKISTTAPAIGTLELLKDDKGAFINVSMNTLLSDEKQPLEYRLNDGKWQENNKLYGVKEGINTVEVRNEAGLKSSSTKMVYLSVFLGNEDGFSSKSLYNYIKATPTSWTKESVTVSLCLPADLESKLSVSPYSCNDGPFSSKASVTVTENNKTVQFAVKDIYGNIHRSETYTVKNIDTESPSLEVTSSEGTFKVKASDSLSGVQKITVTSASSSNYVIGTSSALECESLEAAYTAPSNGTYTFTIYDYAGNAATVSSNMTYYTGETPGRSSVVDSNKRSINKAGNGTNSSSASVLGAKSPSYNGLNSKTKKNTESEEVRDEADTVVYSKAGNSKSPELEEAEQIEVYKASEKSLAQPPKMLEVTDIDNSRSLKLKKLAIALLGVAVIAIAVVVAVNTELIKKKERWDK